MNAEISCKIIDCFAYENIKSEAPFEDCFECCHNKKTKNDKHFENCRFEAREGR